MQVGLRGVGATDLQNYGAAGSATEFLPGCSTDPATARRPTGTTAPATSPALPAASPTKPYAAARDEGNSWLDEFGDLSDCFNPFDYLTDDLGITDTDLTYT